MNPRILILLSMAVLLVLAPLNASARKLFVADIEVDDDVDFQGTDSLFKVVDFFDNTSLHEFFPDYTSNSAVFA